MNCPVTFDCSTGYCEYDAFYQVEQMKEWSAKILQKYYKSKCPAAWKIIYWVKTHIRYMTDYEQFGVIDYWLFPDEVLQTGAEDCEGIAFLTASLLESTGLYNTRVAIGMTSFGYHAWVEFADESGVWYVVEATTGQIYKWEDRDRLGYWPDLYIGPTGCAYPMEVDPF